MRHITVVLKNHLSEDFQKNCAYILKTIPALLDNGFKPDNLEFIFFPDFIELYGLDDYETSINAFEQITQFVTCEFAVRPFIIRYENKIIKQMLSWSKHSHPMVRRLSSEGCRPRLPWAIGLPSLKKDPKSILPILENLKNDSSESVRRSVANNLNDISKDNPQITIALVKKWKGVTSETDALTKHACRTLLKQGNLEVLQLFGFGSVDEIRVTDFRTLTPVVKIGEYLNFTFKLLNKSNQPFKIRLEYGVYFQIKNGSLSKKVFQISEKEYKEKSETVINKKHAFKIITTRTFYPGLHQLSIIINGVEFNRADFKLKKVDNLYHPKK